MNTLDRATRLFGKAQKDNHYLYFELAFTHVTEWMAWVVDKSQKAADPSVRSSDGLLVLARGQGLSPAQGGGAGPQEAGSDGV